MNTLANVTVIRGKGACDLIVNGVRDAEVHRINELHAEEMATVKRELKKAKNRMAMMPCELNKKERRYNTLIMLRCGINPNPSVLRKITNTFAVAWSYIWVFGIKYNIWGYWNDEENERIRRELNRG